MGSEQATWRAIKKELDREPNTVDYQRFEDALSAGIPDFNVCFDRIGEAWIELKFVEALPKREDTPIRLRCQKAQLTWIKRRRKCGGIAGLVFLLGYPRTWFVVYDIDLLERLHTADITITELINTINRRGSWNMVSYDSRPREWIDALREAIEMGRL